MAGRKGNDRIGKEAMRYERMRRERRGIEGNFNLIRISNHWRPITFYTYGPRFPNFGPIRRNSRLLAKGAQNRD